MHRAVALDVIAAWVQLIGNGILCEAQHAIVNQKQDIILAQTGNMIFPGVKET